MSKPDDEKSPPTPPLTVTDDDLVRVSREESVSVGAILRTLSGLPVRGLAGERAQRAAEKLRNGHR